MSKIKENQKKEMKRESTTDPLLMTLRAVQSASPDSDNKWPNNDNLHEDGDKDGELGGLFSLYFLLEIIP